MDNQPVTLESLFERVRVLEIDSHPPIDLRPAIVEILADICHCRDCVMHRDKARHGRSAWPSGCRKPGTCERNGVCCYTNCPHEGKAIEIPPEPAPTCSTDPRCPYWPAPDDGCCQDFVPDEQISEPAAQVQDTVAEQSVCTTCGGERRIPRAGPTLTSAWEPCPMCRSKDPVQTPPTDELKAAYVLYRKRIEPESMSKDLGDLKARAIDGHGELWGLIVEHICERGVVSANRVNVQIRTILDRAHALGRAEPQPLTIDWNTALDTYYRTARAPLGTASDGLLAVLRLIPGLDVVEG
jgi:hypothetical protein